MTPKQMTSLQERIEEADTAIHTAMEALTKALQHADTIPTAAESGSIECPHAGVVCPFYEELMRLRNASK